MWWMIGIALGLLLGAVLPFSLPATFSAYAVLLILVGLDGLIAATLQQKKGSFSLYTSAKGMLINAVFACALQWLGVRMEVSLSLAVEIALVLRMLNHLYLLQGIHHKKEDVFAKIDP